MRNITALPTELQAQILSQLTFCDQIHASRACTHWQNIILSFSKPHKDYRYTIIGPPESAPPDTQLQKFFIHRLFFTHFSKTTKPFWIRGTEFRTKVRRGRITEYVFRDWGHTLRGKYEKRRFIETNISQSPMLDEQAIPHHDNPTVEITIRITFNGWEDDGVFDLPPKKIFPKAGASVRQLVKTIHDVTKESFRKARLNTIEIYELDIARKHFNVGDLFELVILVHPFDD
ncbi:hypothetical protein ABW20_dc0108372 [Dactylellina cionopaga]|nr:hypothetical protein ABW20_dc0108372 [Dactylellina cionopaga]